MKLISRQSGRVPVAMLSLSLLAAWMLGGTALGGEPGYLSRAQLGDQIASQGGEARQAELTRLSKRMADSDYWVAQLRRERMAWSVLPRRGNCDGQAPGCRLQAHGAGAGLRTGVGFILAGGCGRSGASGDQ